MRLDHLASKWDRSVESLRDDIQRSMKQGAHVISLTEVADGKRHRALHWEGWTTCHDRDPWQAGEVAILVDDEFGEVQHWETRQIGPDLGPGNAVYAIVAIIRLPSGRRLLVADSHLPSSVETKWRIRRGNEYRKMARNYRKFVREMWREWKPDAKVVWADWNLNLNLAWVRDWVAGLWKGARTLSPRRTPSRGTHGNRLIDWPLTRGLRKRVLRVLALTPGSDHRAVSLEARFKKARRTR